MPHAVNIITGNTHRRHLKGGSGKPPSDWFAILVVFGMMVLIGAAIFAVQLLST